MLVKYIAYAVFRVMMRRLGRDLATRPGRMTGKSSNQRLDLAPGEFVRVRSREEIYQTIGPDRKNRGLSYDIEMEPFSGKVFPVLGSVERLVDEKTGKMLKLSRDCVILDGAFCKGCLSTNRLFCPRSIYPVLERGVAGAGPVTRPDANNSAGPPWEHRRQLAVEHDAAAADMPLVSIVTPAYNEEKDLAQCIESVLAQTYTNWDYLIVNDRSTDQVLWRSPRNTPGQTKNSCAYQPGVSSGHGQFQHGISTNLAPG